MKKAYYILLLSLLVSSCATVETPPLDDAYYWPDKSAASDTQTTQEAEPAQTTSIEYLNVQDTTVTIRINK